jgi:hypothetical protein
MVTIVTVTIDVWHLPDATLRTSYAAISRLGIKINFLSLVMKNILYAITIRV